MTGSDGRRTEAAAEHLAALIRIPTVSAEPHGHAERIRAVHDVLRDAYPHLHGAATAVDVGETGRVWHWPAVGSAPGVPHDPIVLMAHADVVPARAEDGWTHPPFAGVVADGIVHGRGALDDKGALVVAFEAVEALAAAGVRPARDVLLWVGGNEEVLGADAVAFADWLRAREVRPWIVLDEGGAVVDAPLPGLDVEAAMIGVGEKGVLTIRLEARSAPGHASAPAGRSATERIARAVDRLHRHPFPARLPAPARRMLRDLAPHARGAARPLLRLLAAMPALTAVVFGRVGGDAGALVRTTTAVTMLDGGTAANVLAAGATATLNLRLAPGTTAASAARRVARVVRDRAVRVVVVEREEPTRTAPADNAQFAALRRAAASAYPEAVAAPYVTLAATDARHLQRDVLETYRFAPLRMTGAQRASIHGVDEHVTVDALECGIRFHLALLEGLA